MALDRNVRTMLRDLGLLLGVPAVILGYLIATTNPWDYLPWTTHPSSESQIDARLALEARARAAGVHDLVWEGIRLRFPPDFAFITGEPTLELLEIHSARIDNDHWPAQMAFLRLDSAATARFHDAAENCSLVEGRCWTITGGATRIACQRSAGVPDPAVPWTPHVECQAPMRHLRVLINAPYATETELLDRFLAALAAAPDSLQRP